MNIIPIPALRYQEWEWLDKSEDPPMTRFLPEQLVAVEAIASNNGAQGISLHVFSNNKRASALYERHGFNSELMHLVVESKILDSIAKCNSSVRT